MGYDIIVRFQNEYYTKKSDLINLLAYVAGFGKKKQKILYVGTNGLSKDYVKAERQMKKVKKYYNKCDKRVAYHLVVSFPETIQNESLVIATSKRIAKELFSDYQVYYVVHGTKKNLHIHFVINSVSYITGLKYHHSKNDTQLLKKKIEKIFEISSDETAYYLK